MDDGRPVWLWHAVWTKDLPWVQAEGLIWRPEIWLADSRRAASGFLLAHIPDRLLLRVCTADLDPACLHAGYGWSDVASQCRVSLPLYLARLQKAVDLKRASRLRQAALAFNVPELTSELHQAVQRFKPRALWRYTQSIPPTALSMESSSGFYVGLRG